MPTGRLADPDAPNYNIGIAEEDFDLKSERIDRRRAQRLLGKRMADAGLFDLIDNSAYAEQLGVDTDAARSDRDGRGIAFTEALVTLIPEEFLVEDVVNNIDIRSLLFQIRDDSVDEGGTFKINGIEFPSEVRLLADVALVEETQRVTSEAEVALSEANYSPEEIQGRIAELRSEHSDGVGRRTFDSGNLSKVFRDPDTGERRVIDTDTDAPDLGNGAFNFDFESDQTASTDVSEVRFMTQDALQLMMELTDNPLADLERQRQTEDQYLEARALGSETTGLNVLGDPSRVQVTGHRTGEVTEVPGHANLSNADRPRPTQPQSYTLNATLALPNDMSREELLRLQTRMEEAGIFDIPQVGGKPTHAGDPTDQRFKKAWRMLATMSLQTGDTMVKVLADRRVARSTALGGDGTGAAGSNGAAAVLLTDPARLRTSANTIAAAEIGRRLTPDEQNELIGFVHDLERRNAKIQQAEAERSKAQADAEANGEDDLSTMAVGGEVTEAGKQIEDALAESDAEIAAANARADAESSIDPVTGDPITADADVGLDEQVVADIDARMQEQIRAANPLESEGHEAAQSYDMFSRLLAGPGR